MKFPDGTQIVICNPRMEIPDASISSVVHSGKLRGGRDSGRIDSSFLVHFCQLGKFLGARHLQKTPTANGHCEGREGARREMGPGGGDDPGGGAKRSPLLEFMRRDLAENAPKRPGAAVAAVKGAGVDEEGTRPKARSTATTPSLAGAASTAAALKRWRRDVVPRSARGERRDVRVDTDARRAGHHEGDEASDAESSLDGFADYASDSSTGADAENAALNPASSAMRRLRVDDGAPKARPNEPPPEHKVSRRGQTAKEREEDELRLRLERETEEARVVVEAGLRAERNAKRAKAERLRTLQRMAKTHGMIARYREETEAAAVAAAATARAVVERKWRLEATGLTDMVTRHGSHKDTTPSTHEAQLHLAYVRDERLACDARCGACERGELHSAAECALCEALTTPQERDPSTAWRRGHPMFRVDDVGDAATRGTDDDSAAGAARELLRARGQSEVNAWLERTSRVARERTSELSLTRKGLSSFTDSFLSGFHGVTSLKLGRNRLTRLPDLGQLTPLLERLEVSIFPRAFFSFSRVSFPWNRRFGAGHPRTRFFWAARARRRRRPDADAAIWRRISIGE